MNRTSKRSSGNSVLLKHEYVEYVIEQALAKIGGSRENDLCRFLPMSSGGYMHHFTLRKMKLKEPKALVALIEQFIIAMDNPRVVPPKQRAARGSGIGKNRNQITFTRNQLERLFHMAKLSGDKEMLAILHSKKSLATCKKELIQAIHSGTIDQALWDTYVAYCQIKKDSLVAG